MGLLPRAPFAKDAKSAPSAGVGFSEPSEGGLHLLKSQPSNSIKDREEPMYVITGATGNTGSEVAEKLLAEGEQVRVVGRSAKRLEPFVKKGAEAFVADITDAGALTKAFSGAKGVYAMIPPDMSSPDVLAHYQRVGDALAAAIEKSGIKYAVVLSSVGADKPDKTGPVVGLYNLEKKLRRDSWIERPLPATRRLHGKPSAPGWRDQGLRNNGRPWSKAICGYP